MKEVDTDPQAVFDPIAAGIANDQRARRFLGIVGQEEGCLLAPQAGDRNLADWPFVTTQTDGFVEVTDLLVTALGSVDDGLAPGRSREAFQATQDCCTPSPNGDKANAPLVDAGHFTVVDQLGVEVEPLGIASAQGLPKIDKAQQFAGLLGAGDVGVGIAQAAALLLKGEEGQDTRPGYTAPG